MSQSASSRHAAAVYPCSDGKPMAESELHIDCIVYLREALRRCFERRGWRNAYVAANMFLYFVKGDPHAVIAPDIFVVLGAPTHHRDSWQLWSEPKAPDFVLEVTSKSTRREDWTRKRDIYAALGVEEYFLFDPRRDYLTPPPAASGVPAARARVPAAAGPLDMAGRRDERAQPRARSRPARRARGPKAASA